MPRPIKQIPWLTEKGGRWQANWYDAKERRTKSLALHTSDPSEATARFAAFLVNRGQFETDAGPRLTCGQALDDYWREHCATNVIDRGRSEQIVDRLKVWFGAMPLSDIDIPKCREYAEARRAGTTGWTPKQGQRVDRPGKDGTIRLELTALRAAANHAMKWKRIGPTATPPTPMPSIELPLKPVHKFHHLTKDEFKRVLDAASPALREFIMLAYYTAGRRRSIEQLTPFQVDLVRRRITLRRPDETTQQARSKKRRPVVSIDPALLPLVEDLMARNAASGWLLGRNWNFYPDFRKLMVELGLPEKGNPHILRHSRATHLLQSGVSIYNVAKLLGDNVTTVEKVYGDHCPDLVGEAISGAK